MIRTLLAAALALFPVALLACSPARAAEPEPTAVARGAWTEAVSGRPGLALVHAHDAIGDWGTVVDDRGAELCMFALDDSDRAEYGHLAAVCGWTGSAR